MKSGPPCSVKKELVVDLTEPEKSASYVDAIVAMDETLLSFFFHLRSSEDDIDLPPVHFASNVGEEVLVL